MIAFQDFAPKQVTQNVGPLASQWEPFDQAVVAANGWITTNCVAVISIETLLLPNIWNTTARGTLESRMHTASDMAIHWYQVVRVWFDPEQSGPVHRQAV